MMLSSLVSRRSRSAVRTTSFVRQVMSWSPSVAAAVASPAPSMMLFSTKAAAKKAPASPPPPPSSSSSPPPPPSTTTPSQQLAELATSLPHMDAIRYTHKNRTWTFNHIHYYSEALAIGIMENGFIPGDVVLSYLPLHFSEQMVLQFACAKSGLILYTLDPLLATTDLDKAAQALKAALNLTNANILVSQEAGNDVNYISLVQGVIPELRIFDYASGLPFVTPRFPHLRMCFHTGFDQDSKWGWLPLKQMVVPADNLHLYVNSAAITLDTPLAGQFQLDPDGIPTGLGPTLTSQQVLQGNVWPDMSSILQKQFKTVEGVGVIF